MYLRPFRLGVCLVLCVGGLLGLYRLQAETRQQRHQATTPAPCFATAVSTAFRREDRAAVGRGPP